MKCNPESWILSWLASQGSGFDCASMREIIAVNDLRLEKRPSIVFANPCKKSKDVLFSQINNVNTTVIDSKEEVDKLSVKGWNGTSLVRIQVEDKDSLMPFSAKFGLPLNEVRSIGEYAKEKGQRISGVSFHVGSGCKNPEQYKDAIMQAAGAITILKKEGHSSVNTIDIGGGFTSEKEGFAAAASKIREAITPLADTISIIAEPGRFFAEKSHDLFVRVIGRKEMGNGNPGYRYTIDESLYGQFSCIPFDHGTPRWIRIADPAEAGAGAEGRKKLPGILYGRTCDSLDMIAASPNMEELREGDWLWFPNMGAYTTVTSTEFNGFPKPYAMVIESHNQNQLPDATSPEFSSLWPSHVQYVNSVKVPTIPFTNSKLPCVNP